MPFAEMAPTCPLLSFSFLQQPFHGELVCGDRLFVEQQRTDQATLFVLADVRGHGSAAGFVADLLCLFLQDNHCWNRSPADLLQTLNGMLLAYWAANPSAEERFVTALVLLADGQAASLRAARAGSPEPYLREPAGIWVLWPVPGGVPFGFITLPDDGYPEDTRAFPPGTKVLACTDGVIEACWHSPSPVQGAVQFQEAALEAFLASLPEELTGPRLLAELFFVLRSFVGYCWPQDDTTALCLWAPQNEG